MARDDDELAEAIADLSRTLGDLRHELEPRRGPRLRPPTPGELLEAADEVAIPALIAILEANVRALEAFQRTLRLFRREREVRERVDGEVTRERATELRRTTLDQLEGALAELQRALSEGGSPRDPRVGDLLEDARELRDDVDRRVAEFANDRRTADGSQSGDDSSGTRIEIEIEDDESEDERRSGDSVDVDAELETLRDQYAPDEADFDDDHGGAAGVDDGSDDDVDDGSVDSVDESVDGIDDETDRDDRDTGTDGDADPSGSDDAP